MSIKFVFENEVHQCSKVPADFSGLLSALKMVLKETLPRSFSLQYDDPDGDKIMLTSQEDFLAMMENEKDVNTTVKVYITPLGDGAAGAKAQGKDKEQPKEEEKEKAPKLPDKVAEKIVESKKVTEPELQKSIDDYSIISEKKNELEIAVSAAEQSTSDLKFDPELEAKVNVLVLQALKNNIGVVAGAVRENILESREVVKPVSSAALIDSLVYIQKLAQGVEGATAEQIHRLDHTIKTAVENCKTILQQKVSSKPLTKAEHIKQGEQHRNEGSSNQEKQEKLQEKKEEETKAVPKKKPDIRAQLPYDAEFVNEVSQLPVEAKETDITLYKTVVIKNTGTAIFPPKTFIECVNSNENSRIALPQLEPGKQCTTVLLINSDGRPGIWCSEWGFTAELPDGKVTKFGKEFGIEYEIVALKVEEKKKPKDEPRQDKKAFVEQKGYPEEVKKKAIQIIEVFPQYNLDDICEYIAKAPQKTTDELFNDYMAFHNSIVQ